MKNVHELVVGDFTFFVSTSRPSPKALFFQPSVISVEFMKFCETVFLYQEQFFYVCISKDMTQTHQSTNKIHSQRQKTKGNMEQI